MWKLQPSIYVRIHKGARHNTTWCRDCELGPCEYNAENTEHPTATFPLHRWPLRTAAGDTGLTVCIWSTGSVSQWHQPAFVKEYKFPSLPNTYSVFWTLSKASCAHSLPSQVIFFLQDLQITLATPVQEQQKVSRPDGLQNQNNSTASRSLSSWTSTWHLRLLLSLHVIRCVSHVVIVCVCEWVTPWSLLLQSFLWSLWGTPNGRRVRWVSLLQATTAGCYCRMVLQAATAGCSCRLLLQAATATFLKPPYTFSIFNFIYSFFSPTFPTCRTNRRSLGTLQRSSARALSLSLFPVAKLPAVCGPVRQKKDLSIENTMQHSSKIRWQYSSKWD